MGISFKLSKKGARYQAKARAVAAEAGDEVELGGFGSPRGFSGAGSKREVRFPFSLTFNFCFPIIGFDLRWRFSCLDDYWLEFCC